MKQGDSRSIPLRRLTALILSVIFSAVPLFIKPAYYMTGDDYLLNYIANGSYGTGGSSHLVFIRVLYGAVLKVLYSLTASVNWYLVLLVLLLIISFFIFYSEILMTAPSGLYLLPAVLVHALIIPHFLSFTVTAFLCGGAGAVLWTRALRLKKFRLRLLTALTGSFLLLICRCLRKDSFLPCLAVMSPLLLHAFVTAVRQSAGKKEVKESLLLVIAGFAVLFAAVTASEQAERYAYSDTDWHTFRSYTFARSAVVDFPPVSYKKNREAFEKAGLTELDYDLLRGWKYAEKNLFSEETLREVSRISSGAVTVSSRISYAKRTCPLPYLLFFLLPLLLLTALAAANRPWPLGFGILQVLVCAGLEVFLLFFRMRFVIRVAGPLTMLTLICLVLLTDSSGHPRHRPAACVCFVLFLTAGAGFMTYYAEETRVPRISPDEWPKSQIVSAMETHKDTLYILDGSILNVLFYNGTPVTEVLTTDRFSNIMRAGSWDSFSPRYYAQAGRFVSDPENLLTSFARDPGTVFVGTEADLITAFLEEQTGALFVAGKETFPELQTCFFRFYPYEAPGS